MESPYHDFWGHVLTVKKHAHDEWARGLTDGKLTEFECSWLDREGGKITKLSEQAWFADAEPIPRKIAADNIRREVIDLVKYGRWIMKAFAFAERP